MVLSLQLGLSAAGERRVPVPLCRELRCSRYWERPWRALFRRLRESLRASLPIGGGQSFYGVLLQRETCRPAADVHAVPVEAATAEDEAHMTQMSLKAVPVAEDLNRPCARGIGTPDPLYQH